MTYFLWHGGSDDKLAGAPHHISLWRKLFPIKKNHIVIWLKWRSLPLKSWEWRQAYRSSSSYFFVKKVVSYQNFISFFLVKIRILFHIVIWLMWFTTDIMGVTISLQELLIIFLCEESHFLSQFLFRSPPMVHKRFDYLCEANLYQGWMVRKHRLLGFGEVEERELLYTP